METRLRAIEEHNATLDGKVTNLSVKMEDLHREIQGANKRSREVAESLAMILELHTFRLDEIKKAVEPAHTDAIDFDAAVHAGSKSTCFSSSPSDVPKEAMRTVVNKGALQVELVASIPNNCYRYRTTSG